MFKRFKFFKFPLYFLFLCCLLLILNVSSSNQNPPLIVEDDQKDKLKEFFSSIKQKKNSLKTEFDVKIIYLNNLIENNKNVFFQKKEENLSKVISKLNLKIIYQKEWFKEALNFFQENKISILPINDQKESKLSLSIRVNFILKSNKTSYVDFFEKSNIKICQRSDKLEKPECLLEKNIYFTKQNIFLKTEKKIEKIKKELLILIKRSIYKQWEEIFLEFL